MEHLLERMLFYPSAEPTNLPLSLLKAITNDFSDDRKIGSGGFADVYKVRVDVEDGPKSTHHRGS
jgi:coatomer subunit beta'